MREHSNFITKWETRFTKTSRTVLSFKVFITMIRKILLLSTLISWSWADAVPRGSTNLYWLPKDYPTQCPDVAPGMNCNYDCNKVSTQRARKIKKSSGRKKTREIK